LAFNKDETDAMFTIVAGILHLGNVNFTETGDRKCQVHNVHCDHAAMTLSYALHWVIMAD